MTKKIAPTRSTATAETKPVESSKAVGTTKVGDVSDVQAPVQKAPSSRTRRPTRPMTASEREHLFKLIHEEADKMFGANDLPESQRHTVEEAVRKTIDASIVDEDDEQS